MEIRRLLELDKIDDVSRIYAESWKSAYKGILPQAYLDSIPKDNWSGYLLHEVENLWIVLDETEIVGASTYCAAREEAYKGWGEIVSIYLLPSHFHKGIGAKLLAASMRELEAMGFDSMYLWVLEENHAARSFYEKNGFKWNGEELEDNIGGKVVKELRYVTRYFQSNSV